MTAVNPTATAKLFRVSAVDGDGFLRSVQNRAVQMAEITSAVNAATAIQAGPNIRTSPCVKAEP